MSDRAWIGAVQWLHVCGVVLTRWPCSSRAGGRERLSWPFWRACRAIVCRVSCMYSESTCHVYIFIVITGRRVSKRTTCLTHGSRKTHDPASVLRWGRTRHRELPHAGTRSAVDFDHTVRLKVVRLVCEW